MLIEKNKGLCVNDWDFFCLYGALLWMNFYLDVLGVVTVMLCYQIEVPLLCYQIEVPNSNNGFLLMILFWLHEATG